MLSPSGALPWLSASKALRPLPRIILFQARDCSSPAFSLVPARFVLLPAPFRSEHCAAWPGPAHDVNSHSFRPAEPRFLHLSNGSSASGFGVEAYQVPEKWQWLCKGHFLALGLPCNARRPCVCWLFLFGESFSTLRTEIVSSLSSYSSRSSYLNPFVDAHRERTQGLPPEQQIGIAKEDSAIF